MLTIMQKIIGLDLLKNYKTYFGIILLVIIVLFSYGVTEDTGGCDGSERSDMKIENANDNRGDINILEPDEAKNEINFQEMVLDAEIYKGELSGTPQDSDSDGVKNEFDNCPTIPNTSQFDSDSDLAGDLCDEDKDNNEIADINDSCNNIGILKEKASNIYYVYEKKRTASDSNIGTNPSNPLKTISEAINKAHQGDLIVVGAGIYKEHLGIAKPNITITGESINDVIITGTEIIKTRWKKMENDIYLATSWNYNFGETEKGLFNEATQSWDPKVLGKAISGTAWESLNDTEKEKYEVMVNHFDGRQIFSDFKRLEKAFDIKSMSINTFFVDKDDQNKLYVKMAKLDNPSKHSIRASLQIKLLTVNADNVRIRCMTFQGGAGHPRIHSLLLNGDGIKFENNMVTGMGGSGVVIGGKSNLKLSSNRIFKNSHLGIGSYGSKSVLLFNNQTINNGIAWEKLLDKYPSLAGWENGGVKLCEISYYTISQHQSREDFGHGVWIDSGENITIIKSNFLNTKSNGGGLSLEVANNAEVAGSIFYDIKNSDISINQKYAKIHHNIFYKKESNPSILITDTTSCQNNSDKETIAEVYNNIFKGEDTVLQLIGKYADNKAIIKNNIFSNGARGIGIRWSDMESTEIEYNSFYGFAPDKDTNENRNVVFFDSCGECIGLPAECKEDEGNVLDLGDSNIFLNPHLYNKSKYVLVPNSSSQLKNAGVEVGLPYCGSSPDIGAQEYFGECNTKGF